MEPRDYQNEIHPFTNPETGQQEYQDPHHPLAHKDGRVMLNRHLMSVSIDRWLKPGEIVNYRDGNSPNISEENLELNTLEKLSHRLREKATILHCPYCDLPFQVSPTYQNRPVYHNNTYRRMASRKFKIDPEELRQLVWEIPTTQIAALYGVSNKAVEKCCKALGIPKPPRGYWTRQDQEITSQEELG